MRAGPSRYSARLKGAAAHYREARRSLVTPASQQSRRGLDWMNFFLADVQTGFGAFIAFYLAHLNWPQDRIGLALTVGSIAALVSQIPGGWLADAVHWKRGLVAIGIAIIALAALLLGLWPNLIIVFLAEVLHGLTGGIITPAIAAISLGLVGRRAIAVRTGRNYRFSAGGHALTAALMGAAGTYLSESSIFFVAAALCIPALLALSRIRSDEIDYARARNAGRRQQDITVERILDLARNRSLLLFASAIVLFQLADTSMLPLMTEHLSRSIHDQPALWASGLVIVPQIVVAILAPWVGFHSEKRGRRPLLLIGFGLEPVRAGLLALTAYYPVLVVAQILNGITGAIIGVLTVLVITDLTAGTGRFNLTIGVVAALGGIASSISTSATGLFVQTFGERIGYLALAAIAAAATIMIWFFISETKPPKYED